MLSYSLTPMRREVAALVGGLADWVETDMPRVVDARSRTTR
jgi:hypothetical protein